VFAGNAWGATYTVCESECNYDDLSTAISTEGAATYQIVEHTFEIPAQVAILDPGVHIVGAYSDTTLTVPVGAAFNMFFVYNTGCTGFRIEEVDIDLSNFNSGMTSTTGIGIYVHTTPGPTDYSGSIVIDNVGITGGTNAHKGLYVFHDRDTAETLTADIDNLSVTGMANDGALFSEVNTLTIDDSSFTSNGAAGLNIYYSNATLYNITANNNTTHGISVLHSENWSADVWEANGNGAWGFAAGGASVVDYPWNNNFSITNGSASGNVTGGITLDPVDTHYAAGYIYPMAATVSGNTLVGTAGDIHGIYVSYGSGVTVSGNTASGFDNSGIYVTDGTNTITNNTSSGNGLYGLEVSGGADHSIHDNYFYGNNVISGTGSVRLLAVANTLTGMDFYNNLIIGPLAIQDFESGTIANNTMVVGIDTPAMYVDLASDQTGTAGTSIVNNLFVTDHATGVVRVSNMNRATFEGLTITNNGYWQSGSETVNIYFDSDSANNVTEANFSTWASSHSGDINVDPQLNANYYSPLAAIYAGGTDLGYTEDGNGNAQSFPWIGAFGWLWRTEGGQFTGIDFNN